MAYILNQQPLPPAQTPLSYCISISQQANGTPTILHSIIYIQRDVDRELLIRIFISCSYLLGENGNAEMSHQRDKLNCQSPPSYSGGLFVGCDWVALIRWRYTDSCNSYSFQTPYPIHMHVLSIPFYTKMPGLILNMGQPWVGPGFILVLYWWNVIAGSTLQIKLPGLRSFRLTNDSGLTWFQPWSIPGLFYLHPCPTRQ